MREVDALLKRVESGTTTVRDAAILRYMLHDFATSMSGLSGGRCGASEMLGYYYDAAQRICPPEEAYAREPDPA